jgi:hypothetical protein
LRLVQFAELDLHGVGGSDLGGQLPAATVEDDDFIAGLEAKNVAAMMRFAAREDESVRLPLIEREIKAVHH